MRRLAYATALVALVLALPAGAAPRPQLTDARGDWAVASEDILTGRLSTLPERQLAVEITLAEAPGAPAEYVTGFGSGCRSYAMRLLWTGTAAASRVEFYSYTCGQPGETTATEHPASATVSGKRVRFAVPLVAGLRHGSVLRGMWAYADTGALVMSGTSFRNPLVITGDIAYGGRSYVIGK